MITFTNPSKHTPFLIFKEKYNKAQIHGQIAIQAASISSYNNLKKEVDSRYVNIKFLDKNNFIFFTNYNSPKSISFKSHKQISVLFYWSSINTQIRMKAHIKKTSRDYNNIYFKSRSKDKNALAISSSQSQQIKSFNEVIENYEKAKKQDDLSVCPDYWGGYSFSPYEIEFWEGNKFRLNKRIFYKKNNNNWEHSILEP